MKFANQDEAAAAAKSAIAMLPPPNWQIRFWEKNGEWSYALVNENVSIYPAGDQLWSAMVGPKPLTGGPWTTHHIYNHPGKAAVREAEAFRNYVQDHIYLLNSAGKAIKGLEEFEVK